MIVSTLSELEQLGLIKNDSDRLAVQQGCYFDDSYPLRFKKFYESQCVLTEDCFAGQAGDPLKMMSWQYTDIIMPWFGWRNADGSPRFKQLCCFVPKKNNKSGLVAALILYHILVEEKTANCMVVAGDVDQADVVFKFVMNTIEYGPLKKRSSKKHKPGKIWIQENRKRISYTSTDGKRSSIKVISSAPNKSGPSASLICSDEVCEWLPATRARDVLGKLKGATAARQGRHIFISTANFNLEHPGKEKFDLAVDVKNSNIVDTTILAVVYQVAMDASCSCGTCAGDKAGWKCLDQIRLANPSWNITVPASFWADELNATKNSPKSESEFRTLLCNQFCGNPNSWIATNTFSECYSPRKIEEFKHTECVIGVDLSRRQDLSAVVISFREESEVWLFPTCYLPENGILEKEKRDGVKYTHWVDQGYLKLTKGDYINPIEIRQDINELCKQFNVTEVRYDPNYFAETALLMMNQDGLNMVEVPPSINTMHLPTQYFERMVLTKKMHHDGNPLLSWCLSNCAVRTDTQGRIKIDKQRSVARIDAIIASIISVSGWCYYEEQFSWDKVIY